jgi:hypothetical protein
MRTLNLLMITMLSAVAVSSGAAPAVIPMGEFRSIELHDGGNVVVRHGPVQRVTILAGNLRCAHVGLAGGQRLVIENGARDCRHDERLQIEVVTPAISAISVSDGGAIQTLGTFLAQAAIVAHVEQGGTIDIRSMAADAVDASVHSGGRIFTNARATLTATINSGGAITYWGDPRVKKAVRDGGVVVRGTLADADKPLSELSPGLPVIPALPPLPPLPPVPPGR